jgi:F0F1-type ATP synthase assembly protein I
MASAAAASRWFEPSRRPVMAYIGGALVATLVGWLIDDLLQPYLGTGMTLVLSFGISTVIFFIVRRWLNELRHG